MSVWVQFFSIANHIYRVLKIHTIFKTFPDFYQCGVISIFWLKIYIYQIHIKNKIVLNKYRKLMTKIIMSKMYIINLKTPSNLSFPVA